MRISIMLVALCILAGCDEPRVTALNGVKVGESYDLLYPGPAAVRHKKKVLEIREEHGGRFGGNGTYVYVCLTDWKPPIEIGRAGYSREMRPLECPDSGYECIEIARFRKMAQAARDTPAAPSRSN